MGRAISLARPRSSATKALACGSVDSAGPDLFGQVPDGHLGMRHPFGETLLQQAPHLGDQVGQRFQSGSNIGHALRRIRRSCAEDHGRLLLNPFHLAHGQPLVGKPRCFDGPFGVVGQQVIGELVGFGECGPVDGLQYLERGGCLRLAAVNGRPRHIGPTIIEPPVPVIGGGLRTLLHGVVPYEVEEAVEAHGVGGLRRLPLAGRCRTLGELPAGGGKTHRSVKLAAPASRFAPGRGRLAPMAGGLFALGAAVARRPDLWLTAARQVANMAPRRWWLRPPFLPVPDRNFRRFRAVTQYGDEGHTLVPVDVVSWLGWCRDHRQVTRSPSGHR